MKSEKKIKVLKICNIISVLIIIIGLTLMVCSACNGDRYRFAQQELKIITFLCMIIVTTSIYYRVTYGKNPITRYFLLIIILTLLMVGIFMLNNILHYIGFVSLFDYEIAISIKEFCLDDLKYGVCRYISIPLVGIIVFYIIDKRIYTLIKTLFDKIVDLFIALFSKLGLNELCGLNDMEGDDNDGK